VTMAAVARPVENLRISSFSGFFAHVEKSSASYSSTVTRCNNVPERAHVTYARNSHKMNECGKNPTLIGFLSAFATKDRTSLMGEPILLNGTPRHCLGFDLTNRSRVKIQGTCCNMSRNITI